MKLRPPKPLSGRMDGAQINLGAYVFAGQRARCPRYSESVTSANPTREIDFYFSSEQIYRTVGTHHFHPPRLCEIAITIYHPLRPEGRRFPRHRAAGLGCSRFVAVSMTAHGCANQPLLLSRHGIRRYFLLHSEFHNRKGCFLHGIEESRYCPISRAGRPPRLCIDTASRHLTHPFDTSNVVHVGVVGFIPP